MNKDEVKKIKKGMVRSEQMTMKQNRTSTQDEQELKMLLLPLLQSRVDLSTTMSDTTTSQIYVSSFVICKCHFYSNSYSETGKEMVNTNDKGGSTISTKIVK